MIDTVIAQQSAFDEVASDYDAREADNPIMQLMRTRSLAMLETTFPQGSALLDIGCGTGTEALWLARRGRTVFAVDSSAQMLKVLSERAAAAGVLVPSQLMRAGEMSALADQRGDASFDGAYSSFGALNTEPTLGPAVAAISRLVRPGGRIVLSVMNRWCAAETGLLTMTGRAGEAFRRARPSVRVRVGSAVAEVRYPSWPQLRRTLHPGFRIIAVRALPLLLLPGAWPALAPHHRVYQALCSLDQLLARRRPFSWFGDHLLVVAERRTLR